MIRLLKLAVVAAASVFLTGCQVEQGTKRVYLSGLGKDDPVKWDFYCTGGRNSGTWTTIGVPSNWELEGFGTYNYGHDKAKSNEQGRYRRKFKVPASWQGKRVRIVFEGSMTDTEVFVNGKSAGPIHQGGFYRFKYDVTDLVEFGSDELLEVTVSKVSSNKSVESAERKADYWVFGGIYRPVYLEALPAQFIDWTAVNARDNGIFTVDVYLKHLSTADNVTARIVDADGSKLGEQFAADVTPQTEKVTLRTKVAGHKTWTAETPNLYTVVLTLRDGDVPIHTVKQRFGFRTFEVRADTGLFLNGQRIRLKGINRHCFQPDSGRSLSRKISYDDARLIKQMNMNAVRMSHYPPDGHFLEACDELGLYVLDELGGWQQSYDTEVGKKLVKEMVTRDVSHPCILFWDNGNEGGWNTDLDGEFAKYDPQKRPVLHPWEKFSEIDTQHYILYDTVYPGHDSLVKKLGRKTIFMPTEFLHGLYDGGHGAGLEDFWNLINGNLDQSEDFWGAMRGPGAGGFLWALVDEGVVRTGQNGRIDAVGNYAADGILGPYREKEGSFYTVKQIWSPIRITMKEPGEDFEGFIEVYSRYDFINLRDCKFNWRLVKFPKPGSRKTGHTTLHKAELRSPSVVPHSRGWLELDLPKNWRSADAFYLTAIDPYGKRIWTWSWDITKPADYCRRYVKKEIGKPEVTKDQTHLSIRIGDVRFQFSRKTGRLAAVTKKDKTISFGKGPRLLAAQSRFLNLRDYQGQDGYVVQANYTGNLNYAKWTIYSTGWVKLSYRYELNGSFDVMGVAFDYPEDKMKKMRWLGQGPYRVWKNRMKGTTLNVWSNNYNDNIPGVTWIYPEFKGYYADFHWVVFDTAEGKITAISESDDLFLGVYRPKNGSDPKNTRLMLPESGISFLHGIPAIGTKAREAIYLGPQSQKNKASGEYSGTIYLHFDSN